MKAAFDSEYDEEGGGGYLEGLRQEASEQAQLNQAEFSGVDEQARLQYEGVRPGSYVRMEVKGDATPLCTVLDICHYQDSTKTIFNTCMLLAHIRCPL